MVVTAPSPLPPPRTGALRKQDALQRLAHDIDVWVATADPVTGTPHMVPLCFLWDDGTLLVTTADLSRTSRNLQATGTARLALGMTRDVVVINGDVRTLDGEPPDGVCDAYVAKTHFDPRRLRTPYRWFRIQPRTIQAWREINEMTGRDIMRDGRWIVAD